MIQRIQTVFLLLAAILMGLALFFPLFDFSVDDFIIAYHSFGIGEISGREYPTWATNIPNITWGALTFCIICTLLPLINIFLYKNRKLQIKIGYLSILAIIIYYITVFIYFNACLAKIGELSTISVQVGIILPIIALIFNILAIIRIKKDEKLVKSLDRIR